MSKELQCCVSDEYFRRMVTTMEDLFALMPVVSRSHTERELKQCFRDKAKELNILWYEPKFEKLWAMYRKDVEGDFELDLYGWRTV